MKKLCKVYMLVDGASNTIKKIEAEISPKTALYGGFDLERKGVVQIKDNTLQNVLKIRRGDIVITNRTKYAILMKILGGKIILINMNSNHDLTKRKGIKKSLVYYFEYLNYRLCDFVVCLSKIQIKKLKEIGVRNLKVIPLGVDWDLIKKIKRGNEYILSSGTDKGRNYDFIRDKLKGFNLKILDGKKPLPYNEYLKVMGKARVVVFNMDVKKASSSDLCGTTTSFEALLMEKPIITNLQPWLKELYKDNYYVYKTEEELKILLKKKIKFKKRNYEYLKLDKFSEELEKIIKKI